MFAISLKGGIRAWENVKVVKVVYISTHTMMMVMGFATTMKNG